MVDAWGRVMFAGEDVAELLLSGVELSALVITPDGVMDRYNRACLQHNKTSHMIQPPELPRLDPTADTQARQSQWHIPSDYLTLDVRALLLTRCQRPIESDRVIMEMDLFEARGLLPVLRLMCFLVDHWRATGLVWGVGRGSSVASYCLFLIGIHRVDSLEYGLDIFEFLRDTTI